MKGIAVVFFLLTISLVSGLAQAQETGSYWQEPADGSGNQIQRIDDGDGPGGGGGGSSGGGSGTCSNYTTAGTCPKLICEPSVGCQLPGGCGIGVSCTVRYVPGTIYHYCHRSSVVLAYVRAIAVQISLIASRLEI